MIPDDVVDRVREGADIVHIVGEFVKLKRVGASFRGPCPFHQGTHDNFSVSPKGGYICFVCGEKGDVFTFVQKRLGLDFVESVKWVGAKAGVDVPETAGRGNEPDAREPLWEVNATAAEYFRRQIIDDRAGANARDYLSSRRITLADAERFSIGYAPWEIGLMRSYMQTLGFSDERLIEAGLLVQRDEKEEPRPRFRNRLIFPILDPQGRVVGFGGRVLGEGEPKYLNSAESDVFSKRKLLYGLNWAKQSIRKADRLLVVEGYFDVVRVMLAGVPEVVGTLGTSLTEGQAALIRRYTRNVYLLYDPDTAGQKATFRAGDELLRNGVSVRVITLPDGEDPDTYVAKEGAAGLERAIEESIDVFDRKVQILERGGRFGDVRGKREAIDKLLPTIRATADRLLRDLYVARTSEVAGVSKELLYGELGRDAGRDGPDVAGGGASPPAPAAGGTRANGGGGPDQSDARARRRTHRRRGNTAERELVRVLLHQRRYIETVGERVGAESFKDAAYRRIFTELVAARADTTPEDLARRLDEDATEVLQELLEERGGLDRADEMVAGSVNALLSRDIYEELSKIDRSFSLASDEEKDDQMREKKRLLREMQALGPPMWKLFDRSRS